MVHLLISNAAIYALVGRIGDEDNNAFSRSVVLDLDGVELDISARAFSFDYDGGSIEIIAFDISLAYFDLNGIKVNRIFSLVIHLNAATPMLF